MKRGEVWWVDFNPSVAGEIQKPRPAVIISNDSSNQHLNLVQAISLTSNVDKCYPSEAYVNIEGKINKAMADQLMTVSKSRLKSKMSTVSINDMHFDRKRNKSTAWCVNHFLKNLRQPSNSLTAFPQKRYN